MKKLLDSLVNYLLLVCLVAVFTQLAFGQVTSTTATVATSTVTPAVLVDMGTKVYLDWKNVGVWAGLAALINLLVNMTKLPIVGAWIQAKKLKWIRPCLAILLGAVTGASAAVAIGGSIWLGIFNGMLTGSAAVGIHELLAALKGER